MKRISKKNLITHPVKHKKLRRMNKTKDEKLKKLKQITDMIESTFDWGCADEAWDRYAHAVYAIISENPCFEECEQNFLDYMEENKY